MKVYFYIHAEELEYLDKIIKGKKEAGEYQISISPTYFSESYFIGIPYSDFVRLNDQKTFISLISL